jgi:Ca-activated chloride channel homolog
MRSIVLSFALGAALVSIPYGPTSPVRPGRWPVGQDSTRGAIIIGRVTSSAGAPLSSASVSVQGMKVRARTRADGRYSLTVAVALLYQQKASITAWRVGYQAQTKTITLRRGVVDTLDFVLQPSSLQVGEIVAPQERSKPAQQPIGVVADGARYGVAPMGTFVTSSARAVAADTSLSTADEVIVMEREDLAAATAPAPPRILSSAQMLARKQLARPGVLSPGAFESRVAADAGPPATQGTLRARKPDGEVIAEFPLEHTEVAAELSGYLARTVVEQRYKNPFKQAIEAVYIFPLPAMAAVNDFVMQVGPRKIVGVVRPRAEAERIYQEARARGQTASLLTQERPNIFTQSVANIEPGGRVTIKITYFERLNYEHGEYEFVFPMVVGPRYTPRKAEPEAQLAGNTGTPEEWSSDTNVVPDASRISPPVLKPGQRSGHDIALTVTLDAGLPITKLTSVAHRVEIARPSPTRNVVRLASGDSIPNRDFVLRWKVAGAETQFGVLAHRDERGGYLTLTMQPPLQPNDAQVTPREITFIMDVSGSMMGTPIEISKELVTRTLDRLRPEDLFNVVYFASGNAQLWDRARPRTPENVAEAKRFLENVSAGGGTEMLAGLRRALSSTHDPKYVQMYVFLTDGYVGDEERILSVVKNERGDARFFGFGIGSSVNRYLIDGIGENGGGVSYTVLPRDSAYAERSVSRLFDAIDSPVLVDVSIDWNGLPVEDVYPSKLRDLFAGQTINVIARYTRPASGTAYVIGRVGARRVRYPVRVELPAEESEHAALAPAWARYKIADLSTELLSAGESRRSALEREITDLAVEYRLVSQYTAFVAVDESRIVGDGRPLRIMQPVELPEGVSYKGIFGEEPVGIPMRIGAWGLDVQGTAKGVVRVAEVQRGGAAAGAGVGRGAQVKSINGVRVRGVSELERLLLQSGRGSVRVELEPGGVRVLPGP